MVIAWLRLGVGGGIRRRAASVDGDDVQDGTGGEKRAFIGLRMRCRGGKLDSCEIFLSAKRMTSDRIRPLEVRYLLRTHLAPMLLPSASSVSTIGGADGVVGVTVFGVAIFALLRLLSAMLSQRQPCPNHECRKYVPDSSPDTQQQRAVRRKATDA